MKLPKRNWRIGSNCRKFSVGGVYNEADGVHPGWQARNEPGGMLRADRPWAGRIKHKTQRIDTRIHCKINVFRAFKAANLDAGTVRCVVK
jgi:hypothetical protein